MHTAQTILGRAVLLLLCAALRLEEFTLTSAFGGAAALIIGACALPPPDWRSFLLLPPAAGITL